MIYLDKYKAGSLLFKTLSEARMQMNVLRNSIRYNYPPPESIVNIHDYLSKHASSCDYRELSPASRFQFQKTEIVPEAARVLLEKHKQIEFLESFILRISDGRVLGDGTVIVDDNAILSETTTDFHRKQKFHRLLSERKIPTPKHINGRLAVISSPGSNNYFHWTLASIPRFSLLQGMDGEIDYYYVDNRSRFHREWLDFLNIPANKIIAASPESHIEASEVIIPSYVGLPELPAPTALSFLRKFMPKTQPSEKRRIYISRKKSKRRKIINEAQIIPILKKRGFHIVHPGEMSVTEQMQLFAEADIIISPHGAELTNLVFCSAGTKVIEIFSPYYLNPCFKNLADLCNLNHTSLIGKGGARILRLGKDTHHVWSNIQIDIHKLTHEIELIGHTNE